MQQVGRYQLRQPLAERQFAEDMHAHLWLAFDPALQREVVIKMLPANALETAQREGRIMAQLNDVPIVPVYDQGEADGVPFIVMEYMRGATLSDKLQSAPIAPYALLPIAKRLVDGLAAAHAQQIFHCDIKPSNVFFNGDDAYIGDFGIAWVDGNGVSDEPIGTPPFMPPEQWRAERLTPQTDIYQCGVLFFLALTGHYPFQPDAAGSYRHAHCADPVPSVQLFLPELATLVPSLDRFFAQALAKEPACRFQSITEMGDAFSRSIREPIIVPFIDVQSIENEASTVQQFPLRREVWIGASIAVYMLGWLAIAWLTHAGGWIWWLFVLMAAFIAGAVAGVAHYSILRISAGRLGQTVSAKTALPTLWAWSILTVVGLILGGLIFGIGTFGHWLLSMLLPTAGATIQLARHSPPRGFAQFSIVGASWLLIHSLASLPVALLVRS